MRLIIGFFLILTSCAKIGGEGGGGDKKFLLPWRTADGQYQLQEVTISTLASPYELRGEAAEIFYQTTFSTNGIQGSIARPRLTRAGDVYIPLDTESAIAVAMYAQFDRLYFYERQQKSFSQLTWPRKVGVEMNMTGADGSRHNNAHYLTKLDVIAVVPYSQTGVPVALNHGIIAHEHFHAHFQSQVINVLDRVPETKFATVEQIFYPKVGALGSVNPGENFDQRTPRGLNNLILRGWNEGLADLFGALYTGQADFFTESLPGAAEFRELSPSSGRFWPSSVLKDVAKSMVLTKEQKMGIAYGQGTVLARLLYHLAKGGTDTPKALSARMLSRLAAIPAQIAPVINSNVLDFDAIVPVLLEDYPLNPRTCQLLSAAVNPETMTRSFAKCAQ